MSDESTPFLPSSRIRWPFLTWVDYEPAPGEAADVRGRRIPLTPVTQGGRVMARPNVIGAWDEERRHLDHARWLLMKRAVMPGEPEMAAFEERRPWNLAGWLGWAVGGAVVGGVFVAVALSGG